MERQGFDYHQRFSGPADHEFSVSIPTTHDSSVAITIHVTAVDETMMFWAYSIVIDDMEVDHGALRTRAPHTHAGTASILASFLAPAYADDSALHARFVLFAEREEP